MPTYLTADQLARDLALRDLSAPSGGPHAMQKIADLAVGALRDAWRVPVRCSHDAPRVVSVADNYDHLNFTGDAASRDQRYTRYVDSEHMLRSHSSALIPAALRELATDPVDDVLLACPAMVYRRDAIDRLHTGTPHQLDLWRIARHPLGNADMDQMTELLCRALVPGLTWRVESRVHPYTLDGRQVDVDWNGTWVEVWECGLAHPAVLSRAGLEGWSGLALGLGLDRVLMMRKSVPDIRLLRSTDERVADQMLDLSSYRAVSSMPAITRDLSVAVPADDAAEELGDRVREALGDDAEAVEEVRVLSETPYASLPSSAVERMGMSPSHKNVLVRVVLRALDRTLSDSEANAMRDAIYAALHRGAVMEWAT